MSPEQSFFERLIVPELVKKIPVLYEMQSFITHIYRILPLAPVLSQINPFHTVF
jgi:hypothetical protein